MYIVDLYTVDLLQVSFCNWPSVKSGLLLMTFCDKQFSVTGLLP